jgi:beta-glucosidase
MSFPKDFVWGAASSAYQIEGSSLADGGGKSVWDEFCARPGAINNGESGEVSCDSYHRYAEDIALLAQLGINHYRFSTSWARVDPQGDGVWNAGGLAYYDRLVDCCLEHGITPWVTLFHWETPQAIEDRGGWLNRESALAFGRFAGMMAEHFKGRVTNYFTLNEPEIVLLLGHSNGRHAPGKQLPQEEVFTCWKHLLLAHGYAARAIRAADSSAKVGLVSTGRLCYPRGPADAETARKESFTLRDDDWLFSHNLVLDPACLGRLETQEGTKLHELAAAISQEDWALLHAVPDVIGLNVYNGHEISTGEDGQAVYVDRGPGFPRTALKWPVTPEIMGESLRFIQERYGLPLYITECGQSCNDRIYLDGQVHDPERIDFLHRYLQVLGEGCDKSNVKGFFQWSLTDNFEWNSGYDERFGLIYVDYKTQRRIPKDSARWYAKVAETNGSIL